MELSVVGDTINYFMKCRGPNSSWVLFFKMDGYDVESNESFLNDKCIHPIEFGSNIIYFDIMFINFLWSIYIILVYSRDGTHHIKISNANKQKICLVYILEMIIALIKRKSSMKAARLFSVSQTLVSSQDIMSRWNSELCMTNRKR